MCGIHGFVNGKERNNKADDYVKQGFVAGGLRGMDACGIASIDTNSETLAWQKLPVSGAVFITDKLAAKLITSAMTAKTITIGHTRQATSGGLEVSSAHPFYINSVYHENFTREMIGVHNGSLSGWNHKKGASNYDVDSEWALNRIFDDGEDAFSEFNGPFCFVWWDSLEPDVLNIALNKDRTMHVAFTTKGSMVYASEAGMLHWLCQRNEIALDGPVLKLASDHWYKFCVDDLKSFTKEKLQEVKVSSNYNRHTGSYKTNVEKVSEILKLTHSTAGEQGAKDTRTNNKSSVTVFPDEILKAKNVCLMNRKAKFFPLNDTDDGGVEGMVTTDNGGEFIGIIRCFPPSMAYVANKTSWDVSIIGVQDDGRDIVAVCSRPYNVPVSMAH